MLNIASQNREKKHERGTRSCLLFTGQYRVVYGASAVATGLISRQRQAVNIYTLVRE
jgi:hypothetical protein